MANDVRMVRVTGTGAARTGRCRLMSVSVLVGSGGAGRLTITDGSGGATLFDADFPQSGGATVDVPGSGVLASSGLHVSAATNLTAATLFFEG